MGSGMLLMGRTNFKLIGGGGGDDGGGEKEDPNFAPKMCDDNDKENLRCVEDCSSQFLAEFLEKLTMYLGRFDGAGRTNKNSIKCEVNRVGVMCVALGITDTLQPLFNKDHFHSVILTDFRNAPISKEGTIRKSNIMLT